MIDDLVRSRALRCGNLDRLWFSCLSYFAKYQKDEGQQARRYDVRPGVVRQTDTTFILGWKAATERHKYSHNASDDHATKNIPTAVAAIHESENEATCGPGDSDADHGMDEETFWLHLSCGDRLQSDSTGRSPVVVCDALG